jgi:hypothetical protein
VLHAKSIEPCDTHAFGFGVWGASTPNAEPRARCTPPAGYSSRRAGALQRPATVPCTTPERCSSRSVTTHTRWPQVHHNTSLARSANGSLEHIACTHAQGAYIRAAQRHELSTRRCSHSTLAWHGSAAWPSQLRRERWPASSLVHQHTHRPRPGPPQQPLNAIAAPHQHSSTAAQQHSSTAAQQHSSSTSTAQVN